MVRSLQNPCTEPHWDTCQAGRERYVQKAGSTALPELVPRTNSKRCRNLFRAKILLFLVICFFLLSIEPTSSKEVQMQGNLPVLYGLKMESTQVLIDVRSSGGTDATHFTLRLDQIRANSYRLSIVRVREDRVKVRDHVVTLALELPEGLNLRNSTFELQNRLVVPSDLLRSDP
ncbi:hypothetical protein [Belnapia moabensis]|uniref:hypothetical protein n=1 Tax=Belnapia moabensis TaxID=365533 RepID=UPI0012EE2416|nr:hypothetical protein [Belnapia moabensis]